MMFTLKSNVVDAIKKTGYKNLYLMPATINLAGVDIELMENE